MDITWEGVIFIWVVFLWPVLLASLYLVWKKSVISRKGKFFFVSVAAGYVLLLIGNFLGPAILFGALKVTGTASIPPEAEPMINVLSVLIMGVLLVLPVVSTHYIAKRFS